MFSGWLMMFSNRATFIEMFPLSEGLLTLADGAGWISRYKGLKGWMVLTNRGPAVLQDLLSNIIWWCSVFLDWKTWLKKEKCYLIKFVGAFSSSHCQCIPSLQGAQREPTWSLLVIVILAVSDPFVDRELVDVSHWRFHLHLSNKPRAFGEHDMVFLLNDDC